MKEIITRYKLQFFEFTMLFVVLKYSWHDLSLFHTFTTGHAPPVSIIYYFHRLIRQVSNSQQCYGELRNAAIISNKTRKGCIFVCIF